MKSLLNLILSKKLEPIEALGCVHLISTDPTEGGLNWKTLEKSQMREINFINSDIIEAMEIQLLFKVYPCLYKL